MDGLDAMNFFIDEALVEDALATLPDGATPAIVDVVRTATFSPDTARPMR